MTKPQSTPDNGVPLSDYQTFGDADLITAKTQAVRFARAMKESPESGYCLSLLGNSGNGKTLLAKAIWRVAAPRGGLSWRPMGEGSYYQPSDRQCVWFDWRTVASSLYDRDFSLVGDLKSCWFLVLDDVGAHTDSKGLASGVFDEVIRARKAKWTIVTSNLLLKDFQAIDTRIASFLVRDKNRVVHVKTIDYALRDIL